MENASKALIMAGSVLIAILVISVLVIFYNNITGLMNTKNDEDITEKVIEFNKQYDVYYRDNLYGSDILSLANKVNDYNKRESSEQGYKELKMKVSISSKIDVRDENGKLIQGIGKKEYTSTELQEIIENKTTGWNSIINEKEKQKIYNYKISYLSGLRTNELEELFNFDKSKIVEAQKQINIYLSYKSGLTTLKSKVFRAVEFKYDNLTGRINFMRFEEI